MRVTEFVDQPGLAYSNVSGFRGTRVFKVWDGVDRSIIISRPESVVDSETQQQLPAYDSDWPDNSGFTYEGLIKLDEYIVEKASDGLLVTAIYSDRRARLNFEATHQSAQDVIPVHIKISMGTPGTTNRTDVWWPTQWIRPYSVRRFFIVRWVQTDSQLSIGHTLDQLNAPIDAQLNHLHRFGTQWGRFEGAIITQQTHDRYQIRYSWLTDSGSPYVPSELQRAITTPPSGSAVTVSDIIRAPRLASRLLDDPSVRDDDGFWIRPPFERVQAVPTFNSGATGPNEPPPTPTYVGILDYPIDASGWQSLPGMS